MIKVISFISNDIVTDNRVHKICSTLAKNGYDVTIVGRKFKNSLRLNDKPYKTHRFHLLFNKGPFFYLSLNFRIFFYILGCKAPIILSNDLDTLPGCYFGSHIRKKKLVFDSHELFSEVPELLNHPKKRKIWRSLEKYLISRTEHTITVSKSIADYYKKQFNKDFEVIMNVNRFRNDTEFEGIEKFRELTIIYQGALNYGRGLDLAIQCMQYLEGIKLCIIGKGDIEDSLKLMVDKNGLKDKVEFIGRIPFEELWYYTTRAHIGISLEEDLGLNYRYALPNKLFDYIQARIPVVVSDLPEMKSIVSKYAIGKILENRSPEILAQIIRDLINEYQEESKVDKYVTNLELAARELCWEREEDKFIHMFNRVYRSAPE